MLFHEMPAAHVEQLGSSRNYRLFFLLNGKVRLEGNEWDSCQVHGQQLLLLSPQCEISCGAFEKSKYVTVNCTGLQSWHNRCYLEELKRYVYSGQELTFSTLPLHEKLKKLLSGFTAYTNNEYQYLEIYDTVFVVLRLLYTNEEMALLLSPMLQGISNEENELRNS
ncbi:hypothetical protein [Bacteroides sp. 51]|uniref:hypothetical protein n=1 Tax=Bacteroides sp. 51 TaxID=2302938 RepID=UPI0013D053E2|nr:hypothetical protein [Bacteroides sp. 51]NDV84937.1 hypothetical protein [Bacteroides sp. 51]